MKSMLNNWKLALGYGAGLWAIMFIGVSALMVTPVPALVQKILEIVLAGVASYILARLYFKKNPAGLKEAVVLFLLWFVIGAILDLLITVQYMARGRGFLVGLREFYGMWTLWVSYAFSLAGMILAAKTAVPQAPASPVPPIK